MKSNSEFNIEELYRSLSGFLRNIRKYFYEIIKILPNNDVNNPISDKAINLEDMIDGLGKLLLYFNNTDKYNIILSKNTLNLANIKNPNISINIDYNSSYFYILNNYYYIKIYCCMLNKQNNILVKPRVEPKNSFSSIKSNPSNNYNDKEELNFKKVIYNYIEQKNYKYIKIIYLEIEKKKEINFEIKLVNLNINLLVNKTENIIKHIKINEIYRPFSNSLLIKLLDDELSDIVNRFSNRFKNNEINLNDYISSFIEYVKDLDLIFYSKCTKCKKNSKYSFTQKAFLPPLIKYNNEKYGNLASFNRNKESLFFHPQCI
jgi:hypothetical protein